MVVGNILLGRRDGTAAQQVRQTVRLQCMYDLRATIANWLLRRRSDLEPVSHAVTRIGCRSTARQRPSVSTRHRRQ